MPTGYTAPLYEGEEIDFATFMLRCSRAWGATIMLRDHDADVLPTEENVTEGDYYANALVKAQCEYVRVRELTPEEIAAEHQAELEERLRLNAEQAAKCGEIRERYEAMLSQVEAWEPPTEEHVKFKEFVVGQLRESIDFDTRPYSQEIEPLTDADWQAQRIERIGREMDRNKEELDKAAERNRERAAWVRALRESLEGVPA